MAAPAVAAARIALLGTGQANAIANAEPVEEGLVTDGGGYAHDRAESGPPGADAARPGPRT